MTTLVIAGAGPNQAALYRKARELNLRTVALDGNADAVGFRLADVSIQSDINDPGVIEDAARTHDARAIYPAAECSVLSCAIAADTLGLVGPGTRAAEAMRNKALLRERLAGAGITEPKHARVRTRAEAVEAVRALGLPCVMKPVDGYASRGVSIVEDPSQVEAAYDLAAFQTDRDVIVEAYLDGPEFCVDGIVYEGVFHLGGVTGKEVSAPPHRFDLGIHMPSRQSEFEVRDLGRCVERALEALDARTSTIHAEVIATPSGPRIVEIAGRPGGGRIPSDLIPSTTGRDYLAESLRAVLGVKPNAFEMPSAGAALHWIPVAAGTVRAVEGVERARNQPGVRDVVVGIKVGDTVAPIVDCASRDRIGYVFAEGATNEEAIGRAKAAIDLIRIETDSP